MKQVSVMRIMSLRGGHLLFPTKQSPNNGRLLTCTGVRRKCRLGTRAPRSDMFLVRVAKHITIFLLSSFLLFSCTPATQTASQTEVVKVYATSAAQPWLTELYDCAENLPVVLNVNADEPDIYLRVGEPENIVSPVYQIDEEEIWIVTHRESPILNMSLAELQSLFAGQGEPSIQVWVYTSEEDVQRVFDQFVMKGRSVTSLARLAANPQNMLSVLESDRQAIGILPLTWSMKMNGSRGIYHVATVPVLAITQSEPQGVLMDLISCLQNN